MKEWDGRMCECEYVFVGGRMRIDLTLHTD